MERNNKILLGVGAVLVVIGLVLAGRWEIGRRNSVPAAAITEGEMESTRETVTEEETTEEATEACTEEEIREIPQMFVGPRILETTPLPDPFFLVLDLRKGVMRKRVHVAAEKVTLTKADTVSGNAYELLIFQYLVNEMDVSVAGACGIMANIYRECRFTPNLLQRSCQKSIGMNSADYTASVDKGTYTRFSADSAGYGLCQWTYSTRKAKLLSYAREKKVSISDYKMQLEFVREEIQGNKKIASLWDKIVHAENTAKGAYDAAWYFCYYYEKPKNYEKGSTTRGQIAANDFWPAYGNYVPGRDDVKADRIPPLAGIAGSAVPIYINTGTLQMKVGDRYQLKVTFRNGDEVGSLKWVSSDPKVASVTQSGMVKAVADGSCVITATNLSGTPATCRVTVGAEPESSTEETTEAEESTAAESSTAAETETTGAPEQGSASGGEEPAESTTESVPETEPVTEPPAAAPEEAAGQPEEQKLSEEQRLPEQQLSEQKD